MAGSLAEKHSIPPTSGTMPTHNFLFISFLIGVILLVGLLTYLPAITLAPIAEYFQWVPHR
jgi:K+-transporting ATPase ATPase A chain